jgi:hypothetical protein
VPDLEDRVMETTAALAVVGDGPPGSYAFTLKVLDDGRTYRVAPHRDPDQPRFWCVVVFRCTPAGVPEGPDPWLIGISGLRREELGEALGAIRSDPGGWLASPACAGLRARLFAA